MEIFKFNFYIYVELLVFNIEYDFLYIKDKFVQKCCVFQVDFKYSLYIEE